MIAERCDIKEECTDPVEECDTVENCPDEACEEVEVCTPTDGTEGTAAFWTIQNSWSTGYGDRGFIMIEDTDDIYGILGINYYIQ